MYISIYIHTDNKDINIGIIQIKIKKIYIYIYIYVPRAAAKLIELSTVGEDDEGNFCIT